MKQTKKRILFSILMAAMLLFASLGIATLFTQKRALADDDETETTTVKYVNIEDAVNDDYGWKTHNLSFGISGLYASNNYNQTVQLTTTKETYDYAVYTDAKASDDDTDKTTIKSANNYKGNFSFSTKLKTHPAASIKVERNTILTMRFTFYAGVKYIFSCGQSFLSESEPGGYADGYYVILNAFPNNSNTTKMQYLMYKKTGESSEESVTSGTVVFCTVNDNTHSHVVEDGQEMIITYGVYKDSNEDMYGVLKLKTPNSKTYDILEKTVKDEKKVQYMKKVPIQNMCIWDLTIKQDLSFTGMIIGFIVVMII